MKQKKVISCFTALLLSLSLIPGGLVNAADQQQMGTKDGYDYELWNQNGQGSAQATWGNGGSFSCSWSNIENCLFRMGKRLGSTKSYKDYGNISIDYAVDYEPRGNSYMCVYGWTEDPTVEYYIVEAWGDWRPPGQQGGKGTVSADGKSYDIYTSTRYNQASIHGTESFEQYWSVNKTNPATVNQKKTFSGTISVSKHFEQWEQCGMKMGKMYEVALNIEGYRSNGSANVTKNVLSIGGDAGTQTGGQQSDSQQQNNDQQQGGQDWGNMGGQDWGNMGGQDWGNMGGQDWGNFDWGNFDWGNMGGGQDWGQGWNQGGGQDWGQGWNQGGGQDWNQGGQQQGGSADTGTAFKDAFKDFFKIGTSVSPFELNSGADFIKKNYNSITPENELKPDSLLDKNGCQQRGNNVNTQVSLNSVANTMKFCESNGIAMRGHTFVWYSQTPGWFFNQNFQDNGAKVSTDIMDQRLESMIKNTFAAIAQQYPKLELYSYDVCNELFVNDGGGLRPANNSNWVAVYGDDSFVVKAFGYARKYAPSGCKLYVNDYNEYMPAKTKDIVNIATKVKNANNSIDGIGMQSHLDISYPDKTVYETAMKAFLDTGLDLQITELDITSNNDSKQASLYSDIFTLACKYADRIPAVTVWGTNDSISWRSSQNPLPFKSGYQPKEAYSAILKVAENATPPKGSSTVTTTTTAATTTAATTTTTKATTAATTATTKVTTKATEEQKEDALKGDIDQNGAVGASDLSALTKHLLGTKTLSGDALKAADLSGDGKVSIVDLVKLKNILA